LKRLGALSILLIVCGCATPPGQDATPPEQAAAASVVPEETTTPPPAPPPAPVFKPFEGPRATITPRPHVAKIDRTAEQSDLWERVRQGFQMPDLDNALVREKTAYYAARPEYLQRIFDRSKLYLFHIVEELEKRNLPTELALLPMVESAFNPTAYSRAHASGLWQFIPGTARRFDVQQNWWYDGRRDIVDSTNAALDYLQYLYEMHGDWQLALASYNWGENAVARAIAKNRAAGKPTDYAHLSMPLETRHYLPKLQALKNIVSNPEPLGISLEPIPNQPYFTAYDKVVDIDVSLAAKLAEMPVDQFMALNPGFSRPLIRAAVTPRIILPADKVDVFHENLQKLDDKSLVSWRTYNPKKGDTLESIAKKHGTTVSHLKQVNGISPRSRAMPTVMVVPVNQVAAAGMSKLPIMYAPPIPITYRKIYHTVKRGETLASIGKRFGVSTEDMKRLNPKGAIVGEKVTMEVRAVSKPKKRAAPKGKTKTAAG
jgi:membrane-bound lytic murein transglycosylase D